MVMLLWILALVALLLLNAFFVLAEFAMVKARPSRVAELKRQGDRRADLVQDIQHHLDEYLSVCQVGITFASVALGMVGTGMTEAILVAKGHGEAGWLIYALAMSMSYIVVSGSHIVIGELVPKSVAIRITDQASLRSARPLRFFRILFYPPLWVLNHLANAILNLIGLGNRSAEEHHSEDELRILLEQGQERGLLSFRRLLFMENVFDLGGLKVKDAMRPRAKAVCLHLGTPWADNLAVIRQARYSRFPVLGGDPDRPAGFVHVKDALLGESACEPDLARLVRPCLSTQESATLEALLAEMQRRRCHMAVVNNAQGAWTGIIAMEDIIEEIIGTVGDEFESEPPITLGEVLTLGRVVLGVEAATMAGAVRLALGHVPAHDLPMPAQELAKAVLAKERFAPTYLGHGLALPHARLACIDHPLLIIIRSPHGIPLDGGERARLMFLLITPLGQPRVHQKLQARIARLIESSDYVDERLRDAATPAEVLEAIRTGEQASLD